LSCPGRVRRRLDDLRDLARRHAVARGGGGATGNGLGWLATRGLPADPIIAAHALTAHAEEVARPTPAPRPAPVG